MSAREIQRWRPLLDAPLRPSVGGPYVLYTDHLAAVEAELVELAKEMCPDCRENARIISPPDGESGVYARHHHIDHFGLGGHCSSYKIHARIAAMRAK